MVSTFLAVSRQKIFISYADVEPDRTVAQQVAAALGRHHDVFIARNLEPGTNWGDNIEAALQEAEFLIALLSESAAKSPMVIAEIETLHQRCLNAGKPVIIPV